jgi:hypothetical protein
MVFDHFPALVEGCYFTSFGWGELKGLLGQGFIELDVS